MMKATRRTKQVLAAWIAALSLAACGGGGGDHDNSGVTGASSPDPIPATGTGTGTGTPGQAAATTAPALTNDVATDGRNWMNYRRSQIGMSALGHNTTIDAAAQGHSEYQRVNNLNPTHTQEQGKQGFTGATVDKRMQAAGYVFAGSNLVGEVIAASTRQTGFNMAEELITAIYHRFVIFEPMFKEIGTGAAGTAAGYVYFTADMAANNGLGAGLPANTVGVWPFNGQTQVQPNFFTDNEEPDPVPGVNEVGYPISVHANSNATMVVQSFAVRVHGGGSELPVYTVNNAASSSDPTQRHVLSAAAIIPKTPLAAATTYDVSFSGTVNGVATSKAWSFTTK